MNEYRSIAGTINECPMPQVPMETLQSRLDETMGCLKELLMAMDDMSIALFGETCRRPDEKAPCEAKCMSETAGVLRSQARVALDSFIGIRKKLI